MKPLITAVALLAAAPAFATDIRDPFTGSRPNTLEFHAGFAYYGTGLVGGARFGIPIVDNGFIGPLNNSVFITVGADLYLLSNIAYLRNSGGVGVGVPVTMQWNFYFTDDWSAFGEAGVNVYFDTYTFQGNGLYLGGSWLISAIGGRYQLSEDMALIGRVGSPYASIGVELSF